MLNAVILAGGLGTRLQQTVPDLPKTLAPIRGKAFLDILLDYIEESHVIDRVILSVGHQKEKILHHLKKHPRTIEVLFSSENYPLGTGGAISKAVEAVHSSSFFVFNGDTLAHLSLKDMMERFSSSSMLAAIYKKNTKHSGWLKINEAGWITSFEEKRQDNPSGWINAGVYLFKKKHFEKPLPEVFSLETFFLPQLLQEGIQSFCFDGLFIDIGTKDSYEQAQTLDL